MDLGPLVPVSDSHRSAIAVAAHAREKTDRELRNRDEFALADHSGYAAAVVGPHAAPIVEQLALRNGRVQFPRRIAPRAKAGATPAAAPGEPVSVAIQVSAREGYALWAEE